MYVFLILRSICFLLLGYQRELTYQHFDGSFSAFGDHDNSGSMWLTAFVAKSFHQAKRHTYIDPDIIKKAIYWMISHQAPDGHFPEPGRMLDTHMQGGSQSGPGLTAFVLIALLENNDLGRNIQRSIDLAANRALSYLEAHVATVTDDYVLAIAAYALKLANSRMFTTAFDKLNQKAIIKDGLKYWHRVKTPKSQYQRTDPIDIEMTAYALLVYGVNDDFAGGLPVMKWIIKQRNSLGGFSSTQVRLYENVVCIGPETGNTRELNSGDIDLHSLVTDTVIGLQALANFASRMYSKNFDIQATFTADTLSHTFTINQNNALVLQSVPLPSVPNQLTVTATGHGFALVDISVKFNIEQEIEPPSFDIQVTLIKETVDLLSVETCAKWLHTGASGMAVQEFGIPTGFEADLESIAGLTDIKRVETENRKVILYFDEISTTPVCLTLDVIRTGLVAKSQPAPIKLYDYYHPNCVIKEKSVGVQTGLSLKYEHIYCLDGPTCNQVTKFYQSQVLHNTNICNICADCGCSAAAGI